MNKATVEQKRRLRAFLVGNEKFKSTLRVQHEDITAQLKKGHLASDDSHYYMAAVCTEERTQNAAFTEQREMERLLGLLEEGGLGHLPEKKKDGWIRIMFENWNSLGVFTHSWKIDRLNYLIRQLKIDLVMGCEVQCDWRFTECGRHFLDLLCPDQAKKSIASHNINKHICRDQMGGTAIATIGRLCDVVSDIGQDPTGLGRYSWVILSNGKWTTRIVSGVPALQTWKECKGTYGLGTAVALLPGKRQ